ncbi:hypothetical protein QQF64_003267 [Cirrhinus molitorella]|uniref:CCHC-type domain-containing protein n=1 Tax=Cirrhinus molitorella TaxID=172907 RepID=A0ABR3MK76_9TELE
MSQDGPVGLMDVDDHYDVYTAGTVGQDFSLPLNDMNHLNITMDRTYQPEEDIYTAADEMPQPSAPLDIAKFKIKVDWTEPFPERCRAKLEKALQSWLSGLEGTPSVLSLELMEYPSCAEVQITPSTDPKTDLTYSLPDSFSRPRQKLPQRVSLETQVELLQAEVSVLQQCLNDSLQLQQSILRRFCPPDVDTSAAPQAQLPPMASSTPHSRVSPGQVPLQGTTDNTGSFRNVTFSPQPNSSDASNTSRILASVLYQSRLEPTVFTGDGHISPEDWLQSFNVYRTSLDLTDAQILLELPRFLAKEPKKWFSVLDTHVVTWAQFCDFFKKVFLPSDSQEQIMRDILDRIQSPEEPLPTFVAHMLSEFKKLKTPPPEQEQIDLICKHALEKYRVALYGTSVSSGMDLLLRAHELHVVLGPSKSSLPSMQSKAKFGRETYCYKCSRPGFTSRTCPNCNSPSVTPSQQSEASTHLEPALDVRDTNNPESIQAGEGNPFVRHKGNSKGGRMIRRGNPPSRR